MRLAYGQRGLDDSSADVVDPLPAMPPPVKTGLLVAFAFGLSALHFWLGAGNRTAPLVVSAGLHSFLLVAIGSGAVAFLLRRHWRLVNGFLICWSVLAGGALLVNGIRWYF